MKPRKIGSLQPKIEDRRMKRARLKRDGLSWRQACLQSSYSLATANRGPRGYVVNNPGVVRDFERAAAEAVWKPEQLRKINNTYSQAEGRHAEIAAVASP